MEDNKIMLIDFSDNVLHDESWALKQPIGPVVFVQPRTDSGPDELSLAVGEGRNGSNALRVRCNDKATQGLPGFWLMRYSKNKSSLGNLFSDQAYFVPRGQKANRVHIWVKFPKGFREKFSEQIPTGNPYHQNFVIGTYQYDPGRIQGERVVESDNWHGYHELAIRHDLAQDDWIHIVSNQIPGDQRGASSEPMADYCADSGNYWELLTRIYFDCIKYFGEPEIDYPVDMLVDSIYLTYEEEESLVEVNINDFKEGEIVEIVAGKTTTFDVTVKNKTDQIIQGNLMQRIAYGFSPKLENPLDPKNTSSILLNLQPNETKAFKLSVSPKKAGGRFLGGVMFIPSQEMTTKENKYLPSKNDPNVGSTKVVASDAEVPDYKQIRLVSVSELSNKYQPVSRGGQYYETSINKEYSGKLEGFSRNNTPLTFSLVSQQPKGGKLNLNSNGTFAFVPEKDFKGSFFFRYKINDGVADSRNYGSWVIVKEITKRELTDQEIIRIALDNLGVEIEKEIQQSSNVILFSLNRTKADLELTLVNLADKQLIVFALERFKPLVEKTAQDLNANLDLARIDQIITNL